MNKPNPDETPCWVVYRINEGRGYLYEDESVAREALWRVRHDGVEAYLFASEGASPKCFLLEDDDPCQHGRPVACTQCWNALSELTVPTRRCE